MNIQLLTRETLEEASDLFNEYRKFYGQSSDKEGAKAFLTARFEQDQSILWLASIDGQAAGFVQMYPSFSSVAMKRMYILNDLFVMPEFRQQGVAQALMETCYTYCERHQARKIRLETANDNYSAQRLYKKMGMQVDQHVKHYMKTWE
ncbi:GNAT family N-acetyltransferase [Bacillus sp. FJAT-52991]|uniref:GNAT family N-acetyltransferase n=1 Tax=Bacillus kandeliae TaxID=3129297 RepID=A0ABZ2N5R4_9BACI